VLLGKQINRDFNIYKLHRVLAFAEKLQEQEPEQEKEVRKDLK
jgi:hypothetical protein